MLDGYWDFHSLQKREISDISKYELYRLLTKRKKKKVIGLMKDELCVKIVTVFSVSRPKTYSCLTDEHDEKTQKKCVIKRKLKFEGSKHCLEATQLENKTNQQERNKLHVNILRQNHKEFIKNNKLILTSQSRFNPICDGPLLGFSGMLGKKA